LTVESDLHVGFLSVYLIVHRAALHIFMEEGSSASCVRIDHVLREGRAHWDESGTRGLLGGVLIGPKLRSIYLMFPQLSLMEHVITVNGRYLSKELFCFNN
jgi:hypothetical protein